MWLRPHVWPTLYFCWTRMHRLSVHHCQHYASFPVPSMDTAPGQLDSQWGSGIFTIPLKLHQIMLSFNFYSHSSLNSSDQ